MKFKKKFKEKTKLTQVNLTNPLHTKWDWDKKIIYIYFFIKEIEKKNKVKSIKKNWEKKFEFTRVNLTNPNPG
jgi:hypothetical protein